LMQQKQIRLQHSTDADRSMAAHNLHRSSSSNRVLLRSSID
jgi:hypothetical protein